MFQDSSTVGSTAEIPDIFDVLEGGEDEGAVRYLLGFNGDESGVGLLGQVETFGGMEVMDKYVGESMNLGLSGTYGNNHVPTTTTAAVAPAATTVLQNKATDAAVRPVNGSASNKKRDTSGAKAIHNCDSCGKSFTTKFNLKRHINMHCHKSKENGVPIQGPPSASAPAKKSEKAMSKSELGLTGLQATENHPHQPLQPTAHISSPQTTVLTPNHGLVHGPAAGVPYSRVLTVPQTEYQRPEPDSTYKLPSVQTILPVSTVYTTINTAAVVNSFSTVAASCDSSGTVSSVTSSSHNTDFGTLPADLFDPDSSRSQPPTPTTSPSRSQAGVEESKPAQVTLTSVPVGWTRRLAVDTRRVSYLSPLGKVFNSREEIVQYFKTFNFHVPLDLFSFDPDMKDSEDEGESEDEDDEDDEEEDEDDDEPDDDDDEDDGEGMLCAKRRRSDTKYSHASPPLGAPTSPGPTSASSPPA